MKLNKSRKMQSDTGLNYNRSKRAGGSTKKLEGGYFEILSAVKPQGSCGVGLISYSHFCLTAVSSS